MVKRYQIVHNFKKWHTAESFDNQKRAIAFALRVLKSNQGMREVKVKDNKTFKIKAHFKKEIIKKAIRRAIIKKVVKRAIRKKVRRAVIKKVIKRRIARRR